MNLLLLFKSFFFIGIGAYGGGMAAISLIYYEVVTVHGWLSPAEMKDIITISQMTPGPVAINSATFIGYKLDGVLGAVIATIAVITPSIFILIGLVFVTRSRIFKSHVTKLIDINRLKESVQPGVLALLLYALWTFGQNALVSVSMALLAAFSLIFIFAIVIKKKNPIIAIVFAGIIGIFLYF